jgi:hypothetical protein
MKSLNVVKDGIAFAPGASMNDWNVSGTAAVSTPFLSLVGLSELSVKPRGSASLALGGAGSSNLEIALMLDLTGSMCPAVGTVPAGVGPCTSGPKMDALKQAAKDLIDIVVWEGQSAGNPGSRVALVPFSTRIRVGADGSTEGATYMKKLTNLDPTWTGWYETCTSSNNGTGGSETGGTWVCYNYTAQHKVQWKVMPCVTDRFRDGIDNLTTAGKANWNTSDAAPGLDNWLNAHGGDRMPVAWDSLDVTPGPDAAGKTHIGLNKFDPANHWNYTPGGDCADVSNGNIILPLTFDKTALFARLDALEAYGSTGGPMGTQWAWYMLSPEWKTIWPADSEPGDYGDLTALGPNGEPKLKKIAVIMTDGVYNTLRGWKDADTGDMSDYAKKVCAQMKAKNIQVYTIGFGLDQLPDVDRVKAIDTLQQCSTSSMIDGDVATLTYKFYNAETPAGLKSAFRDIALQLTKLRATQ